MEFISATKLFTNVPINNTALRETKRMYVKQTLINHLLAYGSQNTTCKSKHRCTSSSTAAFSWSWAIHIQYRCPPGVFTCGLII